MSVWQFVQFNYMVNKYSTSNDHINMDTIMRIEMLTLQRKHYLVHIYIYAHHQKIDFD